MSSPALKGLMKYASVNGNENNVLLLNTQLWYLKETTGRPCFGGVYHIFVDELYLKYVIWCINATESLKGLNIYVNDVVISISGIVIQFSHTFIYFLMIYATSAKRKHNLFWKETKTPPKE